MKIPIARSYFDKKELMLADKVIRSGWIGQGVTVERFEEEVRRYLGAHYAIAVSSGTAALHIALLIAGVGREDAVIVPSFSFIATANAVAYCGAKPIFIDIDPDTYNIDPVEIERYFLDKCRFDAKKKRLIDKASGAAIKAIMPVHQFGLSCDIDAVSSLAKKYGLPVIEDAACALGSKYKRNRIGNDSTLACFSFHPRKIITTGEGGIIVTDNKLYADEARVLRNHGSIVTAGGRHSGKGIVSKEDYEVLGFNYRLTDLQAAIGIGQMSRLPHILKKRKIIAQRYDKAFAGVASIKTPRIPGYAVPNYQSYIIKMRNGCGLSRDRVIELLSERGISTRRGNTAIHMQSVYRNGRRGVELPCTEEAARDTIALPIYFEMTIAEQDYMIDNLLKIIRR